MACEGTSLELISSVKQLDHIKPKSKIINQCKMYIYQCVESIAIVQCINLVNVLFHNNYDKDLKTMEFRLDINCKLHHGHLHSTINIINVITSSNDIIFFCTAANTGAYINNCIHLW